METARAISLTCSLLRSDNVREKETTEGDSDNSVGAHPQQRDSGGTTEVNAVPAAAVDAVATSSARQDFIFGKD